MQTIQILIKSVYGESKFYPLCDKALSFTTISKTITLDRSQLKIIESLGFTIEYYITMNDRNIKLEGV